MSEVINASLNEEYRKETIKIFEIVSDMIMLSCIYTMALRYLEKRGMA